MWDRAKAQIYSSRYLRTLRHLSGSGTVVRYVTWHMCQGVSAAEPVGKAECLVTQLCSDPRMNEWPPLLSPVALAEPLSVSPDFRGASVSAYCQPCVSPEPQIYFVSGSLLGRSLLGITENRTFSRKGELFGTEEQVERMSSLVFSAMFPSSHSIQTPSWNCYKTQPFLTILRHLMQSDAVISRIFFFFRAIKSSVLGGPTEIKGKIPGRAKGSICVP